MSFGTNILYFCFTAVKYSPIISLLIIRSEFSSAGKLPRVFSHGISEWVNRNCCNWPAKQYGCYAFALCIGGLRFQIRFVLFQHHQVKIRVLVNSQPHIRLSMALHLIFRKNPKSSLTAQYKKDF
jgi:hypothetical protein